jgi:hypothetical protein
MSKEDWGEGIMITCTNCHAPICKAFPPIAWQTAQYYRYYCDDCELPEGVEVTA